MFNPDPATPPSDFLAYVSATLQNPSSYLQIPASLLLSNYSDRQLNNTITRGLPNKPKASEAFSAFVTGMQPGAKSGPMAGALFSYFFNQGRYTRRRKDIRTIMRSILISRPIASLTNSERVITQGMASLYANNAVSHSAWNVYLAHLAFSNNEHCDYVLDPGHAHHQDAQYSISLLRELHKDQLPQTKAILADAAAKIARFQASPPLNSNAVQPSPLDHGARWMTVADFDDQASLSLRRTEASLLIGFTDDASQAPVYFNGNEALLSVGSAGSFKSTAQVIRNLLVYPGSAVVLDVKGELWDITAGHRRKTYGPVYRFSPCAADCRSHAFNPFDLISTDPQQAASDCLAFSYQVISNNPNAKEPYWENKARNFLWAYATLIAIAAKPQNRNLSQLAAFLSLDPNSASPFVKDKLNDLKESLRTVGTRHGIADLVHAADALTSGARASDSDRLESILDTARSHFASLTVGAFGAKVTSSSDWHPLDLRKHPGTTIYINVPSTEIESYAPILRLMFYLHMRVLLAHQAKPKEPPITFFLDELPQLGHFKSILQLQDVGRGSGLRLWMLVQNIGQLRAAYGVERGESIPEDSRVRCYLKMDDRLADLLSQRLGKTMNILSGESEPLVAAHRLRGPEFRGKMVVLSTGDYPLTLKKIPYFADLAHLVITPPPVPKLL